MGLFLFGCDVILSIPFRGSKKYWVKTVKRFVEDQSYTYVAEPFGGSGILTVNLKDAGLIAKGVINDYDHYFDDYERIINIKQQLIDGLLQRGAVKNYYHRMPQEHIEWLQSQVRQYDGDTRYKIRNNFTFGNYNWDVKDFEYFMGNTDMSKEWAYLKAYRQNTIAHCDWKVFIDTYQKQDGLLIVDPPYIDTSNIGYRSELSVNDFCLLIQSISKTGMDFLLFEDKRNQALTEEQLKLYDLPFDRLEQSRRLPNARGKERKQRTEYCYVVQR